MSRILLSYASEYDKGEGAHVSRVLQRMGHDVTDVNVAATASGTGSPGRLVRGFPADTTIQELVGEFGSDLFLYVEPVALVPLGLESSPIPTACVLADPHRNLESRQRLARLFDHVFLYHQQYLRSFSEHPADAVQWWPCGIDTQTFRDQGVTRNLDVAHIGQLFDAGSERSRLIAAVQRRFGLNEQRYYLQSEIPEVYSRAKIVLNVPVAGDLNFRFFEALACGALLITKRFAAGQERWFQENVHYVAFETADELISQIQYYLVHDEQRLAIARAGQQEVVQRHTLECRLAELLDRVRTGPQRCAPARQMSPNQVLRIYGTLYERAGRVDTLLKLAAQPAGRGVRARLLTTAFKSFARRAVLGW